MTVKHDNDTAALEVFRRLQDDDELQLSMSLVCSVIRELGSDARPTAVYFQVSVWLRDLNRTRRLARR